jgi:hypothetical protein
LRWVAILSSATALFANGLDTTPVAECGEESFVKSIGNSTTTYRDLENEEDVKMIVYVLAESVAVRMREHGFKANTVAISVRDSQLFSYEKQCKTEQPTMLATDLVRYAMKLFRESYHWRRGIRSIGVKTTDFVPVTDPVQLDFFADHRRSEKEEMRMTPSEKKKFMLQNPKNQLITKTDLAKVRNTWDGLPHIVSKGAQTNFNYFAQKISEQWDDTDGLLFGDKYFQETVALVMLFRYTEKMIPRQLWYQQGYRANIVTYSIALLHNLIRKQFPKKDLDLMNIWSRQTVPIVVQNILIEISELVYHKLIDPSRSVANVTQWCKREGCWNSVKSIKYILPEEIENCLIGMDEMKIAIREAKADQRIVQEVDILTKVAEIPPQQWQNAMKFAMSKRMVLSDELTALRIACQIPNKIPTPAQGKKLVALLDRLYAEGFKL